MRVVKIDGEPWFVAKDVANLLGFSQVPHMLRIPDEDEKGVRIVDTPGGRQEAAIINESGLYSIILKSRKPAAKRFKKWVTGTVLPAIRKDGAYVMGEEKVASGELEETQAGSTAARNSWRELRRTRYQPGADAPSPTALPWQAKEDAPARKGEAATT